MDEEKNIEKKIYEIRGVEVMLDSELAEIYKCTNGTKTINQAVKRNRERFPNDFYFQLTKEEYESISRSQFGTLKIKQGQNVKYLPFVFTEQGVAMLATVIKTDVAAITSVNIMRAFVRMRHYIRYNNALLPNRFLLLEDKVDNNSAKIKELFDKFDPKVISKDCVFYKGKIFDAHYTLLKIFESSKEEIIIIDNYIDKELLNILKDIKRNITIVSSNINQILKEKYEKQYNNITFINNNSFHDRFIIIDKEKLYHCGASFKDLGKKCFAISEIENMNELNEILNSIFNNKNTNKSL